MMDRHGTRPAWSLGRRLVLFLGVAGTTLWLAGIAASTVIITDEINEVFDSALQETAQRLLPLAIDRLAEADQDRAIGQHSDGSEEYLIYQLRDRSGRVLLRSHDAPAAPYAVPLATGFATTDGLHIYTQATADGAYAIQVLERPGHRTEATLDTALGLIYPLLLLLPVGGVVIFWTVGRALRPIHVLRSEIGLRGGHNLSPLSQNGIPLELKPIAEDINRLLARLESVISAERGFAANSAHELRTPVAAAIAQSQRLAAELAGTPHLARVEQIIAALRRLAQLAEKLLQLSRAESGVAASGDVVDLLPVVELIVTELGRQPRAAGRLVLHDDSPGLGKYRAAIDIDAFAIVLRNLLDNALAHGVPGSPVEVSIDSAGRLHVVNDGPVLPAADLERLSQRFVRGKSVAPGFGLGLAIVEMILQQAGGNLELHSPAIGRASGFEAVVVLPKE
jgi:two-component system OmpR family sensor kinase